MTKDQLDAVVRYQRLTRARLWAIRRKWWATADRWLPAQREARKAAEAACPPVVEPMPPYPVR